MSSVHRDNRGKTPYWIGAFTDEFGRRRKRSTETTDKRQAKTIVEGWQKAVDEARGGRLTEIKARQIVNEILERTTGRKLYAPTAQGYFEDWLRKEQGTNSDHSQQKKSQVVRLFLESLGDRRLLSLEAITEADVVRFRDELLTAGRRPVTVNGLVRKILAKPFREARAKGLIQIDPVAGMKAIRDTRIQKETFTPEQIERLIKTAEGDWPGMVIAGYFTGARLSDLANLKWSNIDLAQRTITFCQRKTGTSVKIPLHSELEDYLLSIPSSDNPDRPLFPSFFGKTSSGKSGLSMSFGRLMERAGIDSGAIRKREKGVSRKVSALSFHSLRHSFNSALANAGVSQELRMKLTGHSSVEMNAHYSHHELETVRKAIESISRLPRKT
jgi:integrase